LGKEKEKGNWVYVNDATEYEKYCQSDKINPNARHLEFDPDNYRIVRESDPDWKTLTGNETNYATNSEGEKLFVDGPHIDVKQGKAEGDEVRRGYMVASTGEDKDAEGSRLHDWTQTRGISEKASREGKSGPAPGKRIEDDEESKNVNDDNANGDVAMEDDSSKADGIGKSDDTQEPKQEPPEPKQEPPEPPEPPEPHDQGDSGFSEG
jgi:hypothetical protein